MEYTVYIDKENIYSINSLIDYNNKNKVKPIKIPMTKLKADLEYKTYRPKERQIYSILDVVNDPEEYKCDYDKIIKSSLKYPILIRADKNYIIDGLHRLGKAYIQNKKQGDMFLADS